MKKITNCHLKIIPVSVGVICVIGTILSCQSMPIGYAVIAIQAIALILILIYKPHLAIPCLIFNLASNLEFSTFVNNGDEQLYNLSNTKIAGANIGIYFLIISLLSFFLIRSKFKTRFKFSRPQVFITILFFIMYIQSLLLTIFDYLSESSKTVNFEISYIIGVAYLQLWPIILLFTFMYYISKVENGLKILKYTVGYTMLSTLIACLILNALGFQGTYGASPYYLAPTIIFMAPFIILIFKDPFFELKPYSIYLKFVFLVVIPVLFLNLTGGKIILFLIISIIFSLKNLKIKYWFFILIIISLAIFNFANISDDDVLMRSKLNELISLFDFFSGDWYDSLRASTKFRVDEFINIYQHYIAHPLHIFSGFGIAGGAPDYIRGYGYLADGSFPEVEYANEYFISYHEISSFVIKYGLTGLIVFSCLLMYTYKNLNRSQFLIVGMIWFLFFWGYSQTLAVIGAAILAIGIMEVHSEKNIK